MPSLAPLISSRELEVLRVGGRNEPLRDVAAVERERLRRRVELREARRIGVAGVLDAVPLVEEVLRDARILDDETIVGLGAETGHRPVGAAGQHAPWRSVGIAEHDELVVREVPLRHQAVVQVYLAAQLSAQRLVLVIVRWLERAVGEHEMALLAQRGERGDELGVVQLVERRVDLPALVLGVLQQLQNLRAQQPAQRQAERVRRVRDDAGNVRLLALCLKRASDPLRGDDTLVEIGADMLRRLAGDDHLGGQRARIRRVELQALAVLSDDRNDRVLHLVAWFHAVVPPQEALQRKLPQVRGIELVVVGKSDEAVQVAFAAVEQPAYREAAAICDRLLVGGQPYEAGMIAVVVDLDVDGHRRPPEPVQQPRRSKAIPESTLVQGGLSVGQLAKIKQVVVPWTRKRPLPSITRPSACRPGGAS